MSNSVDPDDYYEPSHLDHRYMQKKKPIVIAKGSERAEVIVFVITIIPS